MAEEEVNVGDLVNGEEIHVVMRNPLRHLRGRVRDLKISQTNPNLRFVTVGAIPLAAAVQNPHPNHPRFYRRIPDAEIKTRARGLAEIIALGKDKPEDGKLLDGRVQDPLRKYTAEYLGLKKTAKKGGRRRRKTRKSRR
jgi:hypothetical protein